MSTDPHIAESHAALDDKDCYACQVRRGEIPSIAERIRSAQMQADGYRANRDQLALEFARVTAELGKARAEIATLDRMCNELDHECNELRRQISRVDIGNPYGWTPDEIARREQASAELDKLVERDD